jgi:hypothetical protein
MSRPVQHIIYLSVEGTLRVSILRDVMSNADSGLDLPSSFLLGIPISLLIQRQVHLIKLIMHLPSPRATGWVAEGGILRRRTVD